MSKHTRDRAILTQTLGSDKSWLGQSQLVSPRQNCRLTSVITPRREIRSGWVLAGRRKNLGQSVRAEPQGKPCGTEHKEEGIKQLKLWDKLLQTPVAESTAHKLNTVHGRGREALAPQSALAFHILLQHQSHSQCKVHHFYQKSFPLQRETTTKQSTNRSMGFICI